MSNGDRILGALEMDSLFVVPSEVVDRCSVCQIRWEA
jgi:hypothetical protein